jgi:hypothetical protein
LPQNTKRPHAASYDYKEYAKQISYSPYLSEKNGDNRAVYMKGLISIYETINEIAKKKIYLPKQDSPSPQQP